MGRPLNKKLFGANANDNIKVQFHDGSSSVPGYIVKQKGSKKFVCKSATGTEATCVLVNKAAAALAAGEMTITVKLDNGTVAQVTKISAHRVVAGGAVYSWNFSTSTSDGAAQVEEAGSDAGMTGATDLEGDETP
jgi:selenocysteine-specific translation elongation factor